MEGSINHSFLNSFTPMNQANTPRDLVPYVNYFYKIYFTGKYISYFYLSVHLHGIVKIVLLVEHYLIQVYERIVLRNCVFQKTWYRIIFEILYNLIHFRMNIIIIVIQ